MRSWWLSLGLVGCLIALTGCGDSAGDDKPNWRGGLVGVYEPAGTPVGKAILHQGHDCFDGCRYGDSLVPVAQRFAAAGFVVYAMEMPPLPHEGPIERFTDPVTRLLDAIGPAYMVGLSGGGWTTSVMTARDPRIIRGYSVAGDLYGRGADDWEQINTDYRATYDAAGDRLLHIYNFNEGGAMSGITGDIGIPYVNDYTATAHTITPWAVDFIVADIAAHVSGTPVAPVAASQ